MSEKYRRMLEFSALDRALKAIIDDMPSQPGMRQLSTSLGLGETYLNGPGGEVAGCGSGPRDEGPSWRLPGQRSDPRLWPSAPNRPRRVI